MRDFEALPIVRYEGPKHLRKVLEMEARKFLGYVKGAMGGGNPYQKYRRQYPDGTIIEVQSINNIPGTPGVDISNIYVPQGGAKGAGKKKRKIEPYRKERILLGIEYTDGHIYNADATDYYYPEAEYIQAWSDFKGFGVLLGDIGGENPAKFNPETAIEWKEQAFLKSPWEGWGPVAFHEKCQGESGPYYSKMTSADRVEKRELIQLDEVGYSAGVKIEFCTSIEYHGNSCYDAFYELNGATRPESCYDDGDTAYQYWYNYNTTWIEVNGAVVLGPYTRFREYHQTNRWVVNENGELANYLVRTRNENGVELYWDIAGVGVDGDIYFYLVEKKTWNNAEIVEVCTQSNKYDGFSPDPDYTTATSSGTITVEGIAGCSGTLTTVYSDTFQQTTSAGRMNASDFRGRCTRIFCDDNEDYKKDGLIYAYSFWEPQLYDEAFEYKEPPLREYGYIENGVNHVTTEGYPSIGVNIPDAEWGDYLDYNFDHNIVPGIPDGYYSSILLRAYKETTEGERLVEE